MSGRFDRLEASAHVALLAEDGGLRIESVDRGARARAWRRTRTVALPEIRSLRSYLVCLHELGHVLGPSPRLRLDSEVAAWDWALAHARWEPTPAAWGTIGRALGSYVARSVQRRDMRIPGPDHPVWRLVPVDHMEVEAIAAAVGDRRAAAWTVWTLVRERVRDPDWSGSRSGR